MIGGGGSCDGVALSQAEPAAPHEKTSSAAPRRLRLLPNDSNIHTPTIGKEYHRSTLAPSSNDLREHEAITLGVRRASEEDLPLVSAILNEAATWLAARGESIWQPSELSPTTLAADVAAGYSEPLRRNAPAHYSIRCSIRRSGTSQISATNT